MNTFNSRQDTDVRSTSYCNVRPVSDDDPMERTGGNNTLCGNDSIRGGKGGDSLNGGVGNDRTRGNNGNDSRPRRSVVKTRAGLIPLIAQDKFAQVQQFENSFEHQITFETRARTSGTRNTLK